MLGVLYMIYQITFEVGAYPQGWVEDGFAWLGDFCTSVLPEGLAQSLVVDGIIAGVGGVVSFVPLIMIMFALISFLEDSGYMARMAYMMDRIFRFFGLHGASVMPYVISGGIAGGCAIPGAMATRTLRSPKEKLATLLTLPYMTCGAKRRFSCCWPGPFPGKRGHGHVPDHDYRLGGGSGGGPPAAFVHRQGRSHAFCHGTAAVPHAHHCSACCCTAGNAPGCI